MSVPMLSGTPDQIMQTMLNAGVHFGHQAKRWNPKMKPYIHSARNGIHILDLDQTLPMLQTASALVTDITSNGGKILFVGTKKQAQEVVAKEAQRSGQFYINRRWLGGTLTNFVTIRQRLKLLKDLERQDASGELDVLPKQEAASKRQELERLQRTIRDRLAFLGRVVFLGRPQVDDRLDALGLQPGEVLHPRLSAGTKVCRGADEVANR